MKISLESAVFFACACAGLACGSKSAPAPVKDAGGGSEAATGGGGSDGGPAADGQSTNLDARPSSDRSSDQMMLEMCPATRAQYDAAVYADASCVDFEDTDRDGVLDCLDRCSFDATKVVPGVCGCGIPDVDSDGDGVPDCIDNCPFDPSNNENGSCGCVGERGLAAAGTACNDPACPQQGATCNAAGVCGNRSACSPAAGCRYIVTEDLGRQYWFCGATLPAVTGPGCVAEDGGTGGGALTRAAAQSACQAKGLTLARIDGFMDNLFIAQFLTGPVWIGANDLQTPGQWYWPSATSDSDKLFWSGGADGGQQNAAFSDWAAGAPGASSCATMRTDARWVDTSCSETHGYICQYQIF